MGKIEIKGHCNCKAAVKPESNTVGYVSIIIFIMDNDSKKLKLTQDSKQSMDFSEEAHDSQMGFC